METVQSFIGEIGRQRMIFQQPDIFFGKGMHPGAILLKCASACWKLTHFSRHQVFWNKIVHIAQEEGFHLARRCHFLWKGGKKLENILTCCSSIWGSWTNLFSIAGVPQCAVSWYRTSLIAGYASQPGRTLRLSGGQPLCLFCGLFGKKGTRLFLKMPLSLFSELNSASFDPFLLGWLHKICGLHFYENSIL